VRLAGTWATCSGVPWATQEVHLDPCLPVASARLETARITAHVLLSWLALLLVRVVEVRCSRSWCRIRQEMDRLHRGVFEGPAGRFVQRTELSPLRQHYLKALEVTAPPRFQAIGPAMDTADAVRP